MYEWHGWATVVASPGIEDDEAAGELQRAAEAQVISLVEGAGEPGLETADGRYANGQLLIWLAG